VKYHSIYLTCLVSLLFGAVNAQVETQVNRQVEKAFLETKNHFDRSYGTNFNLLNGRKYYLLYSSNSHPFLYSDHYRPENLWINGVSFEGIPINYDIYKQKLILQYRSYSGEARKLILNEELIDRFSLNGKDFRRLYFPETGFGYFQVVTSGELSFYFSWGKTMFYSPTSDSTPYNYTKPSRKAYLYKSGQLHSIKSRSAFTNAFEKKYRRDINRFLRKEQINFRSSTDDHINRLMEYCIERTASPW